MVGCWRDLGVAGTQRHVVGKMMFGDVLKRDRMMPSAPPSAQTSARTSSSMGHGQLAIHRDLFATSLIEIESLLYFDGA